MPDQIAPVVPPPTSEVTVRTLESDLAALAASGGMTSSSQSVSVALPVHPIESAHDSHFLSALVGWLAVTLAIVGLAAGAWLLYQRLENAPAPQAASTSTLPVSPAAPSGTLSDLPLTVADHRSLLSKRTPASASFPMIAPAGQLKTRYQLVNDGLAKLPASARVAELIATDAAGSPLSFAGYLSAIGAANLLSKETVTRYLEEDFTLLAVRGQGGFGAAYVLRLKPDQAWIYAEPGVRALESSSELGNLFLQLPGTLSGTFSDASVQDQPVRTATFEKPAGSITYGFFKDRVVIATSRQALDEALLLLCFAPGSC